MRVCFALPLRQTDHTNRYRSNTRSSSTFTCVLEPGDAIMSIPRDDRTRQALMLINELSDALIVWTAVPPHIIATAPGEASAKGRAQQLLVRSARKLCEDIGGAVVLLRQGFTGTPHALMRMCRENVVSVLYLGVAPPSEAERYARFVAAQKPAAARLRLHRLANTLLEKMGDALPAAPRARFQAATLGSVELQQEEQAAAQDRAARDDYLFNSLVTRIAELLKTHVGADAGAFLTTVIDYWIESEVTHNGFYAIETYHVDGGDWQDDLDRLRDVLTMLVDLRVIAAMLTTALLTGFSVSGKLQRPAESHQLAIIAEKAKRFLANLNGNDVSEP
ncbi:MAG: hypothetical protein WBD40_24120 [Tepidisphaeraceae bacterium]